LQNGEKSFRRLHLKTANTEGGLAMGVFLKRHPALLQELHVKTPNMGDVPIMEPSLMEFKKYA